MTLRPPEELQEELDRVLNGEYEPEEEELDFVDELDLPLVEFEDEDDDIAF